MSADQIYQMSHIVAELRRTLEIYRGFFEGPHDADKLNAVSPEIAITIRKALSTQLIVGCAALFTDPFASQKRKNLSIENLCEKHAAAFSADTKALLQYIERVVADMNIKTFRNRLVGHFDLHEYLSTDISINASLRNDQFNDLLIAADKFLNLVIRDAGVFAAGTHLAFYSPIPESRSTAQFIRKLHGS